LYQQIQKKLQNKAKMSKQNSSIQQPSSSAMNPPGVGQSTVASSQILGINSPSTSSSQFPGALDKKDAEMMTSVRASNTRK